MTIRRFRFVILAAVMLAPAPAPAGQPAEVM
jgi:hypothetical protein